MSDTLVGRLRDFYNRETVTTALEAADRIEELEKQLASLQWQPIETAPKDEEILIFQPEPQYIGKVHWCVGLPGWWHSNEVPYTPQPTHWMPLPKEPGDE